MPRSPAPRSHAARTCIACKRGKRRCELPQSSQRLEGGVTLIFEDSCARCRRLQIPCILDATYRYAHLHTLNPAPTPLPQCNESDPPVKVDLHTHPKNVDDYQMFFPRYLPVALLRDFYNRSFAKMPADPCQLAVPEATLDELISDEHALEVGAWYVNPMS